MMNYLTFARREYADPLEQQGEIEVAQPPTPDDVDALELGSDWLELALIPSDAIVWIQRDGQLIRDGMGVHA